MTFREWLIREAGSNVRNKATGGSGIDQSVLHGYAAQFGRPDTPGPIKKGIDAAVTGVGKGVAAGLARRGLEVQAAPGLLPTPGGGEKAGFKSMTLLLQTPKYTHNGNVMDEGSGWNFDSAGFIKKIVEDKSISQKIRLDYKNKNEFVNGQYHPLHKIQGEDGNENWSYDMQKAKQFTRALMVKLMVESPPPKGLTQEEREMYNIYSPEPHSEKVERQGGIYYMVSVFKFNRNKNAPELLGGE